MNVKIRKWCLLYFAICLLAFFNGQAFAEQELDALDDYLHTFIEEHRIPGASIALTNEEGIYYTKTWGITGESEEEITNETPFTIGSISKSLTGLAVMKLVDDGEIELNDPITLHLPWFTMLDDPARQITIKQALIHTSGISTYDGLALSDQEEMTVNPIKARVKQLANVQLTAFPGDKHQYSNANYLILGALIEEVTNQPFAEYMAESVFAPLGMHAAAADFNTAEKNGYLSGYQSWFGIPVKSPLKYDHGGAPYGYMTASTIDMVEFITFLQQTGHKFIREEAIELYNYPHVQTGEDRYYGLGIRVSNPDTYEEMIWHSGSTPNSRSELFFLPDTGWGGVILTNKNHFLEEASLLNLRNGIIRILNGEQPEPVNPPFQIIPVLISALNLIVFFVLTYSLVKIKKDEIKNILTWRIAGILQLLIAIALFPMLTELVGVPWHTVKAFAPDFAFFIYMFFLLLLLNSFIHIFYSIKKPLETFNLRGF
ncbi:serine hydrolase [Alkalihalophilus marmarensis]|uniref:serine hydrolase n=1 Tax=Alkalihalophilus marmarensis TaxID=521377 RepID=UPI00203D1ABA|nr:serine hydrolase [Alkalihalophilus marmarensis]MCM3490687.1 serine hydrolase [Alkalihalophilus marmarensis]